MDCGGVGSVVSTAVINEDIKSAAIKSDAAVTCSSDTKRQVRMNSDVRVVYEDGDTSVHALADDKFTAGTRKPTKPQGRQVEVVDVSKMTAAPECKQQ